MSGGNKYRQICHNGDYMYICIHVPLKSLLRHMTAIKFALVSHLRNSDCCVIQKHKRNSNLSTVLFMLGLDQTYKKC
jgi:hypothetical protein